MAEVTSHGTNAAALMHAEEFAQFVADQLQAVYSNLSIAAAFIERGSPAPGVIGTELDRRADAVKRMRNYQLTGTISALALIREMTDYLPCLVSDTTRSELVRLLIAVHAEYAHREATKRM